MIGHIIAATPSARLQRVQLTVGAVRATLVVTGERRWQRGFFGWRITDPEPFERVPLCWELAAGGVDASGPERTHAAQSRNPIGRGFRNAKSRTPRDEIPVPRIVRDLDHLDDPVGFGFISPNWEPRRSRAGTYDQMWQEERSPLLPIDFDPRFHCCAAPGLTADGYLVGGEPITVDGCGPEPLRTALPVLRPLARLTFTDEQKSELPLAINTVLIDLDARQLRVLWRGEALIHRRLLSLQKIDLSLSGAP
jgi:hypothetical protein